MLALIQKVSKASVEIESKVVSSIGEGYCIFLGIKETDDTQDIDYIIKKILRAKLFPDNKGRFKVNITDKKGQLLIVPQYTLYGDIKLKNSPSFTKAMRPLEASVLFNMFCNRIEDSIENPKFGKFGEFMKVKVINEGPVTFIISSDHLKK